MIEVCPLNKYCYFSKLYKFRAFRKNFYHSEFDFPPFTLIHELKNRENLPRIWASYVTEPTTKNQPLEKEPTFLTNLRLLKKKTNISPVIYSQVL